MKIGITGSLSSGKSTVAKILSKNNKLMFSADKAVINLYSNKKFKKKIKKRFKIKKNNIKSEIKSKLLNKEISLKELGLAVHPFVRKKMREFYKKNSKKEIIFEELYSFVAHLGQKPKPNKSGIITWKFLFNDLYILLNSKKLLSNPCKRSIG